ncbi:MAG TPA: AraC family transcriptional regulator [Clostridiales bacterium]|nr:AraC family transcriptional regulator [Clostridiales bacterium]
MNSSNLTYPFNTLSIALNSSSAKSSLSIILTLSSICSTLLLVKGNLKSSEIAVSVGFCDEYRFCKVFKQKVGLSPKKYSKLMA